MNPNSNPKNKTAIIIGIVVVIVVALAIFLIARKPKTPEQAPVVTDTATTTTTTKPKSVTGKPAEMVTDPKNDSSTMVAKGTATFESKQLGFSFSYPASWGVITQKNTTSSGPDSFEYRLSFANQSDVSVVGKSYSFQRAGTKIRSADLMTDTAAESVCQMKPSEKVATESGVAGLYVRGESLSESGGCVGDDKEVQYMVFDINRTAKNVVFVAADTVAKDELINVARTLKF